MSPSAAFGGAEETQARRGCLTTGQIGRPKPQSPPNLHALDGSAVSRRSDRGWRHAEQLSGPVDAHQRLGFGGPYFCFQFTNPRLKLTNQFRESSQLREVDVHALLIANDLRPPTESQTALQPALSPPPRSAQMWVASPVSSRHSLVDQILRRILVLFKDGQDVREQLLELQVGR